MNICPRISPGGAPIRRHESLKITAVSTLCLDEALWPLFPLALREGLTVGQWAAATSVFLLLHRGRQCLEKPKRLTFNLEICFYCQLFVSFGPYWDPNLFNIKA